MKPLPFMTNVDRDGDDPVWNTGIHRVGTGVLLLVSGVRVVLGLSSSINHS